MMKLIVTTDTFLKTLPVDLKQLQKKALPNQIIPIKKGTELAIAEHFFYSGDVDNKADDHLFVQLNQPLFGQQNTRWFIENPHARIESQEVREEPVPKPNSKVDFGETIYLPGINRPVGIFEPVYHEPTVCNFTWSELTKGGTRIPENAEITQRIVKLCKYMDGVRAFLGNQPIIVTSAYRDPTSNREVGGVPNSRHLVGDAIDFCVEGMSEEAVFQRLKTYHRTGGLAVGNGFVHLDLRPSEELITWDY